MKIDLKIGDLVYIKGTRTDASETRGIEIDIREPTIHDPTECALVAFGNGVHRLCLTRLLEIFSKV